MLFLRYSHISALCLFICVSAELFSLTFAGQKLSENIRPGQAMSVNFCIPKLLSYKTGNVLFCFVFFLIASHCGKHK